MQLGKKGGHFPLGMGPKCDPAGMADKALSCSINCCALIAALFMNSLEAFFNNLILERSTVQETCSYC